jgi:hypothetical protein
LLDSEAAMNRAANRAAVATIKQVERAIRECEGFNVSITPRTAGTRPRNVDYEYDRAARNAFTVDDWKRLRFDRQYPDCEVKVLRQDGRAAARGMTLAKVRSEYGG